MIEETFKNAALRNRACLICFVSCGDPNLDFTEKMVERICASGADIVELGVPFSDPMADGAAIQAASNRALKAGTNVLKILEMVGRLRARGIKNPFVLFSYYNPIFKLGVENMARLSCEAGINAWLIVDVPHEESAEISRHLKGKGIDLIALAAPTSSLERIAELSSDSSGFLYYITVTGVTGERKALPHHFSERLAQVRKASKLPVAAGFGISDKSMAHAAALEADAVVVGSRLVDLSYRTYLEKGESAALESVGAFVEALSAQMHKA